MSAWSRREAILFEHVRPIYEKSGDPGHDLLHVLRVVGLAQDLAHALNANRDIVTAAALLHDVVNVPKNHPDRARASSLAAREADPILVHAQYTEDERARIADAIVEHSYSLGKKPSSLESAILQDADRLDAIGAIGIMRFVTCGARLGSVYYDAREPVAQTRALDDKRFAIDHLYVKLFRLAETMNTEPARHAAEERLAFMKRFIAQLISEIEPRASAPARGPTD